MPQKFLLGKGKYLSAVYTFLNLKKILKNFSRHILLNIFEKDIFPIFELLGALQNRMLQRHSCLLVTLLAERSHSKNFQILRKQEKLKTTVMNQKCFREMEKKYECTSILPKLASANPQTCKP